MPQKKSIKIYIIVGSCGHPVDAPIFTTFKKAENYLESFGILYPSDVKIQEYRPYESK